MTGTGYTQADLDKLRSCMLLGVKEIRVGGRSKTFQTVKEMRDLYDAIAAELAAARMPRRNAPRAVQVVVDA